jgi:hypothetical protein
MFVIQISFFIVTFFSLVSRNLSFMQTTKEVIPRPCIVRCVNMWRVFFFLCHLLNVGACIPMSCHCGRSSGVDHTTPLKCCTFVLFHSVTCYTNLLVSRIHVNTTKLCNVTCTLVATHVILRSLECTTPSMEFAWPHTLFVKGLIIIRIMILFVHV